jgi:hypothetical protein
MIASPRGRRNHLTRARDGFHLQEEVLLHEAIDDADRVGRKLAAEELGEVLGAQRHELLDVLRVHEIGRELRHVIEGNAQSLEHRAQVVEDLLELGLEVLLPDDGAVETDGDLPCDEIQVAGAHLRRVTVATLRRRCARRIDVGNARVAIGRFRRHCASPRGFG